jgi:hypothetical protein
MAVKGAIHRIGQVVGAQADGSGGLAIHVDLNLLHSHLRLNEKVNDPVNSGHRFTDLFRL